MWRSPGLSLTLQVESYVIPGRSEAVRGTGLPSSPLAGTALWGRDLHKWWAHFALWRMCIPVVQEYPFFSVSLSRMLSKLTLLGLLVMSHGMSCVGHDDDHDKDQMPLDYVRFPYQATYYPGDDSGPPLLSSRATFRTVFFLITTVSSPPFFFYSYR